MSIGAGGGRGRSRPLVILVGLVAVLAALVGLLVGVRAFSAQAQPEALSDEELLTRMARAPENAPDFSASLSVEQSVLPTGILEASGQGGAPDISGPLSARVWYGGPDRVRAELQGENGDRVFVRNGSRVWAYDGATNTLRTGRSPDGRAPRTVDHGDESVTPAEVDRLLADLAPTSELTQEEPVRFAGRQAYVLTLSPRDASSTLVDRALALVDSETYLPLRFDLYADGRPDPVFSWRVSNLDVGPVPENLFDFQTPPGAEVAPLDPRDDRPERSEGTKPEGTEPQEVETVAEAQRLVGFDVRELADPPGDRELTGVYLKGTDGVVLTYGSGWGTVVLAQGTGEADAAGVPPSVGGERDELQLPTVDLGGGVEAQELSTPIGSGLHWSEGGVSYVLTGSVPAAELERAARGLR